MSRLARLFQVREGERPTVVLLAALTLLLSAGGALGGNAVDALLFARFGVASLPGLYVALGFCIVVSALAFSAALARGARGRFYVLLLAGLALALVADRVLLAVAGPWVYPASWLAMNVMSSLQGLVGWGLAGLVCDTRQAKRLFPLFAAGGVLGSVLGGLATHPLAAWLQTENLLLAWAATLALAFWLGRRLLATRPEAPAPPGSLAAELRLGFDTVRAVPMLRWLAAAIVLFSILFYSLAFPFAAAATRHFPKLDDLAGFLGLFQAGSTGVAFLVSLFLANRLFARIGLMSAILTFAALYLAGFLVLLALPGFWPVVLFRFLQIAWLYGIAGTAYHAAFNVFPGGRRDAARAFIDGIGTQAGTVIGGLLLLFGQRALPPAGLYAVGAVSAALCVVAVWQARARYLSALLDALSSGQPEVFLPEAEPFRGMRLDAAALHVLSSGLSDARPERRALAAEILGELRGGEAARELEPLLQDPDPGVRLASASTLLRADPARAVELVGPLL
ncbi:MAG TPA: HEAT repeat domain-containing protein, partial [Candidatus Acidoferrales bacterium]|nr:HEAT repeat domain-containing protein [Candidatus Acidoferrales bacterium]